MYGRINEENLYRLECQFKYNDSIKIIRKHVETYEELVRKQAERIERAIQNADEADKLQKEKNVLRKHDRNKSVQQ
jgi:predicted secreted Zn-dependent protease